MKKIWEWKPSEKFIAIALLGAFCLMMYPLLRLTLYTAPFYDDFAYGTYLHNAVLAGGNVIDYIKAAIEHARMMWYAYQGTFASIFFMGLMPAAFGEQYYFIGPLFLFFIFIVGLSLLIGMVVRGVLKANWWQTIIFLVMTLMFIIILIHSAQQAFYWYNGGMHYVGGYGHMSIFLAMVIYVLFVWEKKPGVGSILKLVGALLLATIYGVFTSGSNFVTTLQGMVLMLSLVGLGVLLRKKWALVSIPFVVAYFIGFYMNISAPGNNVRSGEYEGWGYSAFESIWRSFLEAFRWFFKFNTLGTLLFLILLFPIIWKIVTMTKVQFKYPLLVLLWSICVYATGFTPSLYATGRIDLSRVRNVINFTLQLLMLLNEVYITGYLYQKKYAGKEKAAKWDGNVHWWSYAVWVVCFLAVFACTEDKIGGFSPYGAFYYIHSGEAYNFRQEYLERVDTIVNGGDDVEITRFIYRPWFLCQNLEYSTDPNAELNVLTARYYRKNSIRMKEVEE